jgi:hypothetical protein
MKTTALASRSMSTLPPKRADDVKKSRCILRISFRERMAARPSFRARKQPFPPLCGSDNRSRAFMTKRRRDLSRSDERDACIHGDVIAAGRRRRVSSGGARG